MTYHGHIKNGHIELDVPAELPEGAPVTIEVSAQRVRITRPQHRVPLESFEPIQLPGGSLAEELVKDRR
jgi:hypothetical protein